MPKRWNTFLDEYNRNISPDFSRQADRKEALILGENLNKFQYLCPAPPYTSIFGGRGRAECAEKAHFFGNGASKVCLHAALALDSWFYH